MATSYNGWPASQDPSAINIVKFGDNYGFPFPGGARGGDVHTVLGYVATQLHKRVEPCVSGWCWGYNYRANVNNPSTLSCHSSGTAIDWNAPDHPNGASKTFTSAQVGTIRQILAEVQGAIQWGGDYTGTKDEMHFEIIVSAATLAPIAASLAGTTPPPSGDWLDMATQADLEAAVWAQINRPEFLDAVATTVWTKAINDKGAANALLNSAAVNAEWAVAGINNLPVNVWIQPITGDADDQRANALLAKAAAG